MTSEAALRAAAASALDLDALRASLHASLAARLLGTDHAPPRAAQPTCPFARAADALVADHLAATGRHHTLAVFREEAGLDPTATAPAAAAALATLTRLDSAPTLGAAVAAAAERAAAAGTRASFVACLLAGVAEVGGAECGRCEARRAWRRRKRVDGKGA